MANQIVYVQVCIPGRLLTAKGVNSSVYLENVMAEDQMTAAMITFQSFKILLHSSINPCAVFWHVISLQSHGCTPQTKPPGSYFIFSCTCSNAAPCGFLTECYFWSEHSLTCQTWRYEYSRAKVIYKLYKL